MSVKKTKTYLTRFQIKQGNLQNPGAIFPFLAKVFRQNYYQHVLGSFVFLLAVLSYENFKAQIYMKVL